jgi:hypothetical protein
VGSLIESDKRLSSNEINSTFFLKKCPNPILFYCIDDDMLLTRDSVTRYKFYYQIIETYICTTIMY